MKKIFSIIILLISIVTLSGCTTNVDTSMTESYKKGNALAFKEIYESLNGTTNSSGKEHRSLTIPEDNPFVFITPEEIVEKINNGETFYVYFGSAYCPWCRSIIEKAIEVANKNNIDVIYYVDVWQGDHVEILRDTYKLNDAGEPELVKAGTEAYKTLISKLSNVLSDYTLTNDAGEKVSVGEKRIFAPDFVYVENGEGKRITEGISDTQSDSRAELTDEDLKNEEEAFNEFFKAISES